MTTPPAPPGGPDRFRLLASAIAGRQLDVAYAAAGERSWTDGTTIFLAVPAANPIVAVAAQAALVAAGSLSPTIVRRLAGRPALARRYLAVEAHRALAVTGSVLPQRILPLIDDDVADSVDSPAASLAVALHDKSIPDPPADFGVILPRRLRSAAVGATATATISGDTPQRAVPEESSDDLDDDSPNALNLSLLDSVGGRGLLGRLFRRALALRRDSSGGIPGAEMFKSARLVGSDVMPSRTAMTKAGALEALLQVERNSARYPEWDEHGSRYRADWCTVTELDPRPEDGAGGPIPVPRDIHRSLARLGSGFDRRRRRPYGDEVDIDAAIAEQVDAMSGISPEGAVYIEQIRQRHDLSILVLLDVSGSASLPGPAGRTVHEHQVQAVAAITGTLHRLGNRVALYGFCSQGRSAVRLFRVKTFEQPQDSRVAQRLAALTPTGYTRLGAAIRHGSATLQHGGRTSRRLLVVVTDGLAYDHGYEAAYAEADVRRALSEARALGQGCLCLSVGCDAELSALRRAFGPAAHGLVAHPDELGRVAGPLFRNALRSAETRPRRGRVRRTELAMPHRRDER